MRIRVRWVAIATTVAACSNGSMGRSGGAEDDASVSGADTDGDAEAGADTSGSSNDDGSDDGGGPLEGGVVTAQLVGIETEAAPHFRSVDNFNDEDAVLLGVDAGRLGVEGKSCDAYVVASRTSAEWSTDASLLDVRPSGPVAVELTGGLADNRLALAAAGDLSSDAADGLGVAYDVVLDCNRNAVLDAGDVIDGGERPGLFRTHDATIRGPHDVSLLEYSGGSWLGQRTFFPTDIAELADVPLVVVTHGWSYDNTNYDHIGQHLASYGYVVMHHQANVQDGGPDGTITAANDLLANTDYLLANLDSIGGGVLAGHIDASRIMFTGHSTGGESVVRAVTRLREGSFSSEHFGYDDIRIVSSMMPVSWHPRAVVDPGDVNYHMFVAGADDDVSGAPIASYTQCRSIYERATGNRQLTYIHGAGHGDILDFGELFRDEGAPALIGREATKLLADGYFLVLAELYLRDNPAAREFFTRPAAEYRPSGIPSSVVLTNEYRAAQRIVIDDFETSGGGDPLTTSSAGQPVRSSLSNAAEVLMRDNDGSFAWSPDQASNGMTHARHESDDPHALVFDFTVGDAASLEVDLPQTPELGDASVLSFRACQGTRHPETTALGGPLSFAVTLTDGAGVQAQVTVGGPLAVPPPYARSGEGPGVGWGNEFLTIQLRIADFLGEAPELNLDDLQTLRFDFGAEAGSVRGRVGLDDLELIP